MVESIFADRLESYGLRTAMIASDGLAFTYAELAHAADNAAKGLSGTPALVIVEAANIPACVIAYLACLRARFPVLLAEPGSTARDPRIADTFGAAWVFRQSAQGDWRFEQYTNSAISGGPAPVHPDLCILLSTSGSTGSPKLVRLSRTNIDANAASIAAYLGITEDDRALTALPPFYSYGMSVINSHLHAGACLLLTEESVAHDSFWHRVEHERATSFAGVPFTFDILERVGFRSRRYPHLRYLTQAGGRLSAELVQLYGEWAESQGKQFFVMYGQTEAGPRMAYVPPAQLRSNAECIGVPIPGGAFELRKDNGELETQPDQPGELVYRGPNVMMGYALTASDLALGKSVDELRTGDLACRKANGNYYIVGRMSRFAKIVGLRISLDELERWLEAQGVTGAVGGNDELIAVAVVRHDNPAELKHRLLERFELPASAVEVVVMEQLPTLPSGKIDHRSVLRLVREAVAARKAHPVDLRQGYADILGIDAVRETDSFLDLGGDSVSFVEVSLLLEDYLGYVPDNWEARTIASLEALHAAKQAAATAGHVPPPAKQPWRASFWSAVAAMVVFLAAGEGALQLRAYIKTGRSAAALLTDASTVITNPQLGIRTYRPNRVVKGSNDVSFATNSFGLRSPEIRPEPEKQELRLAVVGASTVAGFYARNNDETFPALLQSVLRDKHSGQTINVINAGIEGNSMDDTNHLVQRGLVRLHPSMIIVYPGLNDMAGICAASRGSKVERKALPAPSIPGWVLSANMISQNTVTLRQPAFKAKAIDPAAYFPASYEVTLTEMVRSMRSAGIEPVLMTVARSFDGLDRDKGLKLAESALFYNSCLDYEGVVKAGNMYNQVIARVAAHEKVPLLDLAQEMRGGQRYFVDSIHFNLDGERFVAAFIARELEQRGLLARHVPIDARLSGQ